VAIWDRKDSAVRGFLQAEYLGHCQICGHTFPKTDGTPYFEGLYLVPRLQADWVDREGNVLCLCANCCAKLQFGAVEADGLVEQIMSHRGLNEGGSRPITVTITLLGEERKIEFTERHVIDLQEMLKASEVEAPA
jgi:predicted restriction endonuclease